MGQYSQLSSIFPHFLSPSPYFTLLSIPSASSHADKKDFKLAGQSVCLVHALDHTTRPKTQFWDPLGKLREGEFKTMESQLGGNGCSRPYFILFPVAT